MDHEGLSEIETRYTYLERLVEDLSRVLYEQQRSIDGLFDSSESPGGTRR